MDRRVDGMRGQYSFKSGHFEILGGVVDELASSRDDVRVQGLLLGIQ